MSQRRTNYFTGTGYLGQGGSYVLSGGINTSQAAPLPTGQYRPPILTHEQEKRRDAIENIVQMYKWINSRVMGGEDLYLAAADWYFNQEPEW